MTTQGVMNQSVSELFIPAAVNMGASVKSGTSFQNFLNQNVSSGYKNKATQENVSASKANQNTMISDNNMQTVSKFKSEAVNTDDKGTSADTVSKSTKEDNILFDKVNKLLSKVSAIICDALEISEEELVNRMALMGLSMADILNPQVLQQIVLDDAGTDDMTFLLTNEDTANVLKDIISKVNQLIKDYDIPYEQLQEVIHSEEFTSYLTAKVNENIISNSKESIISDSDEKLNSEDESELELSVHNDKQVYKDKDTVSEKDDKDSEKKDILFEAVKIKADDNSSTGNQKHHDSDLSKDSQIEQGQQFIDRISNALPTFETDFSEQLEMADQIRNIANQIIEQIKVVIRPTQTSLEIQLNPEHLGKVNLNIVSKEGALTAQFTAQNQIAKEAIESNIQLLRENLENQGIKVDAIEVTVSANAFSQDAQTNAEREKDNKQASKKKSVSILDDAGFDEVIMTDSMDASIPSDSGTSIDYTA